MWTEASSLISENSRKGRKKDFVVTVQPCAGLDEKVCCKLACISTFSSKSAYGGTTKLLVFMNMKTRRCNG